MVWQILILKCGLVEFDKEATRMDILSSVWKNQVMLIIYNLCIIDTSVLWWGLSVCLLCQNQVSTACVFGSVPLKLIFPHFPWPYHVYAVLPSKNNLRKKDQLPLADEQDSILPGSSMPLLLCLLARLSCDTAFPWFGSLPLQIKWICLCALLDDHQMRNLSYE